MNPLSPRTWMALLLLACTAALADPPPPADLAAARELFQAGRVEEDRNEAAARAFAAIEAATGPHPLVATYLAAIEIVRGRHALAPWNKVGHVERGLAQLDEALAALAALGAQAGADGLPYASEGRLTAATTLLELPDRFERGAAGIALVQALLADPRLGGYPPAYLRALHTTAARAALKQGESEAARAHLSRAAEFPLTPLAAAELASLREALE